MKNIFFLFLFFSIFVNAQQSDFKHINFKKADSIANNYKNKHLNSLPKLAHLLTRSLDTDVEKFRAIYIWISQNIKGDHNAVSKNARKRKKFINNSTKLNQWNVDFNKVLFKKLRKHKKTVCTGYAYLIRELATYAELDCKIIDGYGRNTEVNIGELSIPNHSWNAVKLNKKWYLVDATWATGYTDLNKNLFIFDYNEGYFLTDPTLFISSHFPLNKKWTLLKNSSKTEESFIAAPLTYGKTLLHQINPIFPKEMQNAISKNEEIVFQLHSKKALELDKFEIQIGNKILNLKNKPTAITSNKGIISINYTFKTKGFYDIHILYKKDIITTYTFMVKK